MSFYKPNAIITIKNYSLSVCIKRHSNYQVSSDVGFEGERLEFVGNIVNSNVSNYNKKLLPNDIIVGDRGNISIDQGNILGDWIFTDIQRTRFKAIENTLGQTFLGVVIIAKNYNPNTDWN
jgi:hypothetical protein